MSLTISEISRRLAEQAEGVSQRLLPGCRMVKAEWVCGSVTGGEGDSLKVHLCGNHAGCWKDWATDEHGDLIDLWRLALNISPGETLRQVKAWLGITDPVHREAKSFKAPPAKPLTPPNPGGRAFAWLTGTRRLSAETLTAFRIETDPGGGALVFPCFSPDGQLLNRSYRTLPPPGEKKKVWQDSGCAPCLFGCR